MKKVIFLFLFTHLLFYSFTRCLYADEEEPDDANFWDSDSDIEQAYQNNEIDEDTYERLITIYEDKIDVNSADIIQLQSLPGLSQIEASKIVDYRLKHGYYKNINELISPEIIDETTYDKIKIFITADLPEKIKTKGDILARTKANIEVDTTEYQRTSELFRLRLLKFGKYLRFGAIVEGDSRYEDFFVDQSGNITGSNFVRGYRLNKSYIGYEKGPLISQAYLGNYRAGFGQGLTFNIGGGSSANGFYPDDGTSSLSTVTYYWTSKIKSKYQTATTSPNLIGFGAKINNGPFDVSGFYSKVKETARVYILHPDGKARKWTLEDRYEEEILGGNINYKLFDRLDVFDTTYLGSTFYTSKRERLTGGTASIDSYPPEEAFAVYGVDFKTGIRGFFLNGEFSQLLNRGNGLYLKTSRRMGKLDVILSYRDYDIDFYNPHARTYSKHSNPSKFRCRDERGYYSEMNYKISKTMKAKFYVDQFKHTAKTEKDDVTGEYYTVYETPTTDRTFSFRYNWSLPRGIKFQADRKWADKDIYKSGTSGEKMVVTTNTQLKFKPSKKTDLSLKYSYTQDYYDTPSKYTPKDAILTRVGYYVAGNLKLSGEIKFSDTDLRKSGKESRAFWLQVDDKLSKNSKLRIRYNNKYAWSSEEYEGADSSTFTDPGYTNSWVAQLEYKW